MRNVTISYCHNRLRNYKKCTHIINKYIWAQYFMESPATTNTQTQNTVQPPLRNEYRTALQYRNKNSNSIYITD